MTHCPIAHWKQRCPDALAFTALTYGHFDELIQKLCHALQPLPAKLIAFTPKPTPLHIAFFFAAWRMRKTVYPLSFRLPSIASRLEKTKAHYIDPEALSLSTPLSITTIDDNLLATYIETSSSRKIACHLFKSHRISAEVAIQALDITPNDAYCLNLPLFHISGIALFIRCFTAGARLLFPEESHLATHISMVPTQLYRLKEPLPKLKCLLVGGAPIPKALPSIYPLYATYGMTECASMAALNDTFLPHIEWKIAPDGELFLRGPSLLHHYFEQAPRQSDEWLATRDIARFEGKLEILGRKDRQFISGGENIQPEEIESALLQIPEILEARVEPKPHEEFGMRPIARIYCEQPISLDQIRETLEKTLPRFKIPDSFEISRAPLKKTKPLLESAPLFPSLSK